MSRGKVSSRQGDVANLDVFVGPLIEQLDGSDLCCDILGQDWVSLVGALDLDLLSVVRHFGDFWYR